MSTTLARLLAGLGIAADALLFVLKAPAPLDAALYALALWLVSPWLIVLALSARAGAPGLLPGAALAAAFEVVAFAATFVAPQGPGAALAYAAKPLWQLGLIGGAIGVAAVNRRRRGDSRGH